MFLDPLKEGFFNSIFTKYSFLRSFCKSNVKAYFESVNWSFHRIEFTKQIDNFYCGVFLLIFIEKLSKARSSAKLKFIHSENNR